MRPVFKFSGTFNEGEKVKVYFAGSWRKGVILTKSEKVYTNGTVENYQVQVENTSTIIPANNFGEYGVRKL